VVRADRRQCSAQAQRGRCLGDTYGWIEPVESRRGQERIEGLARQRPGLERADFDPQPISKTRQPGPMQASSARSSNSAAG
jgi:hypothetical protein